MVQTHRDSESEPRFYVWTRTFSAATSHFCCGAFCLFITWVSRPGSSLFSWHPFFMALAFSFLMTEAVLVFSPVASPIKRWSRQVKGRVHWVLQLLALCCAVLGLASISYNKHLSGKAHFSSWHGLVGVVTVCGVGLQCLAATPLIFHSLAKGWSLARVKRYHAASGLVTYLLGSASLLLGLGSAWFSSSVGEYARYLLGACPVICALLVINQVSGAYLARKRFQS